MQRAPRSASDRFIRLGLGLSGSIMVVALLYYLLLAAKALLGEAAPWAVGAMVTGLYLVSIREAARSPDLPQDIDIEDPQRNG